MDHTPWEDEHAWWFDFLQHEHPDLVEFASYSMPGEKPHITVMAIGELREWLDGYRDLWSYRNTIHGVLTIRTENEAFAFAMNLRWRGTPKTESKFV